MNDSRSDRITLETSSEDRANEEKRMKAAQQADEGVALETAIIFTKQMESLARFYQDGLALGEMQFSPGHIGFQVGPVYLGFDQVDEVPGTGAVTLWLTVDDIEATFEHLVDLGARVKYAPTRKSWGGYLAAVYDPDGNLIGLSQRRKS